MNHVLIITKLQFPRFLYCKEFHSKVNKKIVLLLFSVHRENISFSIFKRTYKVYKLIHDVVYIK